MSRMPRPHLGIMAVVLPFVILLLVLIALEPGRARHADTPATSTAVETVS